MGVVLYNKGYQTIEIFILLQYDHITVMKTETVRWRG